MNKKKLLTLAMVLSMVAILVVGGTIAYFVDVTEEETNTIVIGKIDIELYESKYHRGAAEGKYLDMTGQPHPLDDATIVADDATYHEEYLPNAQLMPFDLSNKANWQQYMFEACTVAKNAYVQNTSATNDCFVRVNYVIPANIAEYLDIFYVDTQFITADEEEATKAAIELNNGDDREPMITTVDSGKANAALQIAEVNENGDYVASFIYAERLIPGEFTKYSPISKITLKHDVDHETLVEIEEGDYEFEISVYAEAIQADGFATALDAFEAFDKQMSEPEPA